jgi:hypothetical protein
MTSLSHWTNSYIAQKMEGDGRCCSDIQAVDLAGQHGYFYRISSHFTKSMRQTTTLITNEDGKLFSGPKSIDVFGASKVVEGNDLRMPELNLASCHCGQVPDQFLQYFLRFPEPLRIPEAAANIKHLGRMKHR